MLAQTLFLIAMIAIFATSAIAGIAGYARAETVTAAKAFVAPAIDSALARYEQTVVAPAIAASYQAGDGTAAPPAAAALNGGVTWRAATYVLAPNAPSPLAAVVVITPTAPVVPACAPAGGAVNRGPDLENNAQCSGFVQESRLSLTIVADVGPASDATTVVPVAHGRVSATVRVFAQPPYAMLAGIEDDAAPGDAHEGDGGGYGNALGAFGPAPRPDDTTIHVLFSCTAASPGACDPSHPAPQDRPTSLPWTNGN